MNTIRGLHPLRQISVIALLVLGIASCGSGSGPTTPSVGVGSGNGTSANYVTLRIIVTDVTQAPIEGAEVSLTAAGVQHQATTNADGKRGLQRPATR